LLAAATVRERRPSEPFEPRHWLRQGSWFFSLITGEDVVDGHAYPKLAAVGFEAISDFPE
jgi:hypothetical protein